MGRPHGRVNLASSNMA
ncbi:hypothetical protein F383_38948 [Gossypium arboreum]|uniref:Uncharacterized protein n=1 Tax=Gossypium arboreum TaxID=29729 RepID=A0A0B0ME48_GOSAR|nr:hypothetical protein F383_38948 [Gossypium arboreum]